MRSLKSVLIALVLLPAFALAQATATKPAAKPGRPAQMPATPEQKATMEKLGNTPADAPAPKYDLQTGPVGGEPNPNFGKVSAGFLAAHKSFMERKKQPIGVLFLGDSITAGWNSAQPIWKEHFGKYDPANFGIGGDRTQHVLWRIDQGELDGISPKVVVLMIGTNNSGYPAEQITAGVTRIVSEIKAKLPNTKVLLLSIFPRTDKAENPTRLKLQEVNKELAKLDDGGKTVRYFELWNQFLTPEGVLSKEIMPDLLHPNAKGYEIWASSMQPLLDEMMK